jgi:hypothetical protein
VAISTFTPLAVLVTFTLCTVANAFAAGRGTAPAGDAAPAIMSTHTNQG